MAEVTVEELSDNGAELVGRVQAGERFTITRSGSPVAELRAVRRQPTTAATLLARWSTLPTVDPDELRAELDRIADSSL
jgi:antitoxin (DNA-binding transcriptional repressor) of toxin-antitoxin stability system